MAPQNNKEGVQVDGDAVRLHEPVTVMVSPAGNEYDADTWSAAHNMLSRGCSFKDGYPTGPEMVLNPDLNPPSGNQRQERSASPAAAPRPAPTASPAASPTPS